MRADRLLSLMLLLNSRGRMTARELAAELEVSERTVYRDIDALCAAGVPLYTQPGTNGGISLDEHYRVSLTGLSRPEVQSLFVSNFGSEDTGPLADLGLGRALEDSLLKLFAALPDIHRSEVERMRQRFFIDPTNWFQIHETPSVFPVIQRAVWEDRVLRVRYQPVEDAAGERMIEAYALVAKANIWYLVGRKPGGEMHSYRVSRFREAELTEERFKREPGFDVAAYWSAACEAFEGRMRETFPPYSAVLSVAPGALWFFPGYMEGRYTQVGEPDERGWITLRVLFDTLGEARMRVLGLGTGVRVCEPEELRREVFAMARSIVAMAEGARG
jgi:predicted DNA-binding transcriptional regulator YafY